MNDPVYSRKYQEGAQRGDLRGKIKQAIDARHTKYLSGWLAGGEAQVESDAADSFTSIDVGREVYQAEYFSTRLGIGGYGGDDSISLGFDAGARLHVPARLSPFVGVGGYAGVQLQDAVPVLLDTAFDLDDSFTSLDREDSDSVGGLAVFYPEIGAHFWLDGKIRLTSFGRYLVSSEGRETDGWAVGAQIGFFTR